MRVLVVGGTGFVGSAIASAYNKDLNVVHTIGRGQHGKATRNTTKELLHFEDVVNYDLIIDCASTVNDYNLLAGDPTDINTNVCRTSCWRSRPRACSATQPYAHDQPDLPSALT